MNLKSSPSTTPDYDVKNINISNLIDQLLKSDIDITSDIPEKYKHMIESNKVDNDEKTILYFLEYWKNSLNGNNLELSPKGLLSSMESTYDNFVKLIESGDTSEYGWIKDPKGISSIFWDNMVRFLKKNLPKKFTTALSRLRTIELIGNGKIISKEDLISDMKSREQYSDEIRELFESSYLDEVIESTKNSKIK
ncbi:MAG: hypothetical protein WC875_03185 [Candidatus Absconditabacterales bacterium]